MTVELVLAALNMALEQRRPAGIIDHSDQSSQHTSLTFGERRKKMDMRPSMGTVGNAYVNAMATSFIASLGCELIERRSFRTKTNAQLAVFSWIERWYNPRRRYSCLGQASPADFKRKDHSAAFMTASRGEAGLPVVGACVASSTSLMDKPVPAPIEVPNTP